MILPGDIKIKRKFQTPRENNAASHSPIEVQKGLNFFWKIFYTLEQSHE
jgi:hypothetical protein